MADTEAFSPPHVHVHVYTDRAGHRPHMPCHRQTGCGDNHYTDTSPLHPFTTSSYSHTKGAVVNDIPSHRDVCPVSPESQTESAVSVCG